MGSGDGRTVPSTQISRPVRLDFRDNLRCVPDIGHGHPTLATVNLILSGELALPRETFLLNGKLISASKDQPGGGVQPIVVSKTCRLAMELLCRDLRTSCRQKAHWS